MRRGRLLAIAGALLVAAVAVALMMGCSSTTQCANGQKALATAQVAYDAAVASGNVKKIQDYHWALDAARAMTAIWCSTQSDEVAVK